MKKAKPFIVYGGDFMTVYKPSKEIKFYNHGHSVAVDIDSMSSPGPLGCSWKDFEFYRWDENKKQYIRIKYNELEDDYGNEFKRTNIQKD